MKGIRNKKCGCVFQHGERTVWCDKHAARAERKAQKEVVQEQKGLRKLATEQAANLGHELKRFEEYGVAGQEGKWTSFCARCGDIVIVYDKLEQAPGDQLCGRPLVEQCRRSALVSGLEGM